MTNTDLRLPLALHEATVEQYRRKDVSPDAELEALGSAMAQARQDIERLAAFAEAVSADRRAPLQAKRSTATSGSEGGRACRGSPRSGTRPRREGCRTDQNSNVAPPRQRTMPPPGWRSRSRQRLAAMPHEDRGKVIAAAIKDDDDLMVGAILRAPPMLSGMSQVEQNYRRALWRQRRYPNEVDREQRLEKAVAALDRGGAAMLAFIRTMTASPEAEAAEQSVKAVAEAQAAVK